MAPRSGRAALLTLLVLLAACGGKGLGIETASRNAAGDAYNITFIPEARREPPYVYKKRSFRFEGTSLGGTPISQAAVSGGAAVVNFWGAWCGDCHREQPMFNAAYKRFSPRGVKFLGVDVRDPIADGRSFVAQYEIGYPSVRDEFLKIAFRFGVYHFPSTYFLDARGRVAAVMVSLPETQGDLDRIIERVMA